ncbi:hypothetical protein HZB02_06435 [Candidatus Woesearchaeota archaeon]|nr:hypothetical protein [Candidatus Woesearchaeota archaeon]
MNIDDTIRIVWFDMHPAVRNMMREKLKDENGNKITIMPYQDPSQLKEVERRVRDFPPNLIITDLIFSEINDGDTAYQFVQQMKQSRELREVPLIVLSAWVSDDPKSKFYNGRFVDAGAVAVYNKHPEYIPPLRELVAYAKPYSPSETPSVQVPSQNPLSCLVGYFNNFFGGTPK